MSHLKKISTSSGQSPRPRLIQRIAWLFGLLVWVAFCLVFCQVIFFILLRFILGDQLTLPVWSAVYQTLAYLAALFLIILLPHRFCKKSSVNRNLLGLKGTPSWTDLGLAPIAYFAYLILATLLSAFFATLFTWFTPDQAQNTGFTNLFFHTDRLIAFIALVCIAPLAEEIIFRGWLYAKLRRHLSYPLAMLLVSALFGLLHFQWNVGLSVFTLSLVLCSLREITGTIYSGIFLHMLSNGIALYLSLTNFML